MKTFQFEKDGKTFEIDVADGEDVNAKIAQAMGSAPAQEQRSLGENFGRSVGRTGRIVTGAAPKLLGGLGDILSRGVNALEVGFDKADRFISGREPDPSFAGSLPTNRVQAIDETLTDVGFPEDETFAERASTLGLEALLTGGSGGVALAARAPRLVKAAAPVTRQALKSTPSVLDDIGAFFAKNPKTASALEVSGGAGASAGGELAADADVGPLGQFAAQLVGGGLGVVAPGVAVSTTRRIAQGARNIAEPITAAGVKTRAARELQARAQDPEAAAVAATDAPESVLPGRASGDPELQAIEARVLADDPKLAKQVSDDLEVAEATALSDLADDLPAGVDPKDFPNRVVQQVAPEGVTIAKGQPDEMIRSAEKGFRTAYQEAEGFPVQTQAVRVEGGNVSLRDMLREAADDPDILTSPEIQKRALQRVEARLAKLESKGARVGGPDDNPIFQVQSDDILELRSAIRTKSSQLRRAGRNNPDAAEEADVLNNMNKVLTEVLESQLPDSASAALRATDAKYAQFKTVEGAIVSSGKKGLTPDALRSSIRRSESPGKVARNETGELGKLAEQGADVPALIGKGKDDEIVRAMRTLDETQVKATQADITRKMIKDASPADAKTGQAQLSGKGLTKQLEKNRSSLVAAGFTPADITRIERIAKRLTTIQSPGARPTAQLMNDNLGALTGLLARVAGAKSAKRITAITGTGGPGILSITGFAARQFERLFKTLNVDGAKNLITDSMQPTAEGRKLFAALMTQSTASAAKRSRADATIKAWIAQSGSTETEDE